MSKLQIIKATTSKLIQLFIQDSSSTTGDGLTGLTAASGSLTAYYYREGAGTGATQISLVAVGALGTWESGGFFEIDATNMPGWYELGLPDGVLAAGVNAVGIQLKGATDMAETNAEIELTNFDNNSATAIAGWLNAAAFAADMDTYQAKVILLDDDTSAADRHVVVFYKNSEPILSGITSPTLQVVKLADGADLIAEQAVTEVGSTGMYQYIASTTERITGGAAYMAITSATIGGSTRVWYQPIGRDS